MCHWKSWIWPGILTVAILSALAVWLRADTIEADVRAQAERRLASGGIGWTAVEADGRDLTVSGTAPLEGQDVAVLEAIEDGYTVRAAETQLELLAAQSPYTLSATRTGDAVVLEGYAPTEAVKAEIAAAAAEALPDSTIEDRLALARGAPDTLAERAAFGFSQLAGVADGRFAMTDDAYSVEGRAATLETYESIDASLAAALPGGLTLGERNVTPPVVSPYVTAGEYDGSTLRLTGFAPSVEAREAVEAAAREALPNATVANELRLADGAPDGFVDQATGALAVLPRLSSGTVRLTDGALDARGTALTGADFESVTGALAGALPGAATLALAEITPPTVTPYTTRVVYDGSALTLAGYAPSVEARDAVEAAAREALPNATLFRPPTSAECRPPCRTPGSISTSPRKATPIPDSSLYCRSTAPSRANSRWRYWSSKRPRRPSPRRARRRRSDGPERRAHARDSCVTGHDPPGGSARRGGHGGDLQPRGPEPYDDARHGAPLGGRPAHLDRRAHRSVRCDRGGHR